MREDSQGPGVRPVPVCTPDEECRNGGGLHGELGTVVLPEVADVVVLAVRSNGLGPDEPGVSHSPPTWTPPKPLALGGGVWATEVSFPHALP